MSKTTILLPQPAEKPPRAVIREPLESEIQITYFDLLRLYESKFPELRWIYNNANGEYRSPLTAKRLKRLGVKAGVWDVFCPIPKHGFHGLYIEFKRNGRSRLTPGQIEFGKFVREAGYKISIFWNAQEAFQKTLEYLGYRI
jgi:hypothetical protein